jgi:hypothetical protein
VTRAEALEQAIQHVDTMAKNPRGFVSETFAARVDAIERFARFLMGGAECDRFHEDES